MKLLLVEDSDVDARLIEAQLRRAYGPVELSRTASLRAAMDMANGGGFDAVLLDLTLDDSLGLDSLAACLKECPDLPIVVVSGEQDEVIGAAALAKGARAFLRKKGLTPEALKRALDAALG